MWKRMVVKDQCKLCGETFEPGVFKFCPTCYNGKEHHELINKKKVE